MTLRLTPLGAGTYVDATLRTLADIGPELRKAAQAEIMSAAQPAVNSVVALIPSKPPMSGWARSRTFPRWDSTSARTGVKVRRRRSGSDRNRDIIPLLSVVQTDRAGAIYDMAMEAQPARTPARSRKNVQFVNNLKGRHGSSSRSMWPGVLAAVPAVEAALRDAVRNMERTINGDL